MSRAASRPSARTAILARLAVVPVALIASGVVVCQASYTVYSLPSGPTHQTPVTAP